MVRAIKVSIVFLILSVNVLAQTRVFTGAIGALPPYTPATIYDEKEAFNSASNELWKYLNNSWLNTTGSSGGSINVTSISEIPINTYAIGSVVHVTSTGANYKIQGLAPVGYSADGLIVIATNGVYAVLQPTDAGYSVKQVQGAVQKLTNFLAATVPSTAGVILADTSLTFTDSLLLRENTVIQGIAPLGDYGSHPLDNPGKIIWTFDINNANKTCIVFQDNGRGYSIQTSLKDLQINVISPVRAVVKVTKPYGTPLDNVRINANTTNRYAKYGVTYCCAVITEFKDVYITGTSVAAIYQEQGAFGSTSTIFTNCYFTRSKIGVQLYDAEPFFHNCFIENIDSIGFLLENGANLKFENGGWENTPLGPNGYFVRGVGPSNRVYVSNISYGGSGATTNQVFSSVNGKTIVNSVNISNYPTLIAPNKIGIWDNVVNYNCQSWNSLKNRYNTLSNCTYLTGDATAYDWEPYSLLDSMIASRAIISNSELFGSILSNVNLVGSLAGGSNYAESTEDFTNTSNWVLNSNTNFNGAITRTANASAAPNTEVTADRITKSSSTLSRIFPGSAQVLAQFDSLVLGQRYTYSVYAKKPVGSDIKLRIGGFTTSDTINIAADDNWYRLTHTAVCNNKSNANALYFIDIIGTAGNYVDLWGFQMNPGGLDNYIPNSTSAGIYKKKRLILGSIYILSGVGSPEGVEYAPKGSMFLREDGSTTTTLYIKTTDNNLSTGWTAK